jgi:hypothetical protein
MNKQEASEALDGLMLGDGSIERSYYLARYAMKQSKHTISIDDHMKFMHYLQEHLFSILNIQSVVNQGQGKHSYETVSGNKSFQFAQLRTERTKLLTDVYDEWYTGGEWAVSESHRNQPSQYYKRNATKIIPIRIMNMQVLPIYTLAYWYLGDGGSDRPDRSPHTVYVDFSGCKFTEYEISHLITMLNNMNILTNKSAHQECKSGAGLIIRIAQESVDYFMSLIDKPVMDIFKDSIGPSYKDMVKYKYSIPIKFRNKEDTLNDLRAQFAVRKV